MPISRELMEQWSQRPEPADLFGSYALQLATQYAQWLSETAA